MFLNLHIKNYALIEDLHLEFAPGFNVFTGETGAGKSIIIESLGLILGERAAAQSVRKGANRCCITGEFDCAKLSELKKFLEESGLNGDGDGLLIIRREVDSAGRSRAFVNDQPVSVNMLESIGGYLVDVHGQHEHQSLLNGAYQRRLLDGFGGHDELRHETAKLYRHWMQLLAKKQSNQISEQEKQRLIDLYGFQVKEIDGAKLLPGEEEEIERLLPQLKNAEKLRDMSEEAHQILYGLDGAILEKLNKVQRLLDTVNSLGGGLGETADNLKNACYLVEEAARDIDDFRDHIKADPARLNEFMERQDTVHRLKRKYGQSIGEILAYRDKISADLSALLQSDQDRQELDQQILKAEAELNGTCKKLSAARKKAAARLTAGVEKELTDLGMKKARFDAAVTPETEPTGEGADRIEFMFSANAGEDLKPLRSIASGGEMSRVMLALKTVLAKADRIPVLVFDEIDAGIGGPMGQTVGKKLKTLSAHRQVVCITHLPQIAAFGNKHIAVTKEAKGGRTLTLVRPLAAKERLEEVARMLSGETVTAAARKHAAELIDQSLG